VTDGQPEQGFGSSRETLEATNRGTNGAAVDATAEVVNQGATSGSAGERNQVPVNVVSSDHVGKGAAGTPEVPAMENLQDPSGTSLDGDSSAAATDVAVTTLSVSPIGTQGAYAGTDGEGAVNSANTAQVSIGGRGHSVLSRDVSTSTDTAAATVDVDDNATTTVIPNLTRKKIDRVQTALDAVDQVQDRLDSSAITLAALGGEASPEAKQDASTITEGDSPQITEAVAEAIAVIESSARTSPLLRETRSPPSQRA
jgi:hypothetical protein